MNAAAAAVMATLTSAVLTSYPTSVPSSANIQALITTLSPPNVVASQSVFTAFDDACAVASLLLTIGQGTGLGSNGFTNGYVSAGTSGGTSGPSVSFTPGQTATHLSYFSPVTSSASFTSAADSEPEPEPGSLTLLVSSVRRYPTGPGYLRVHRHSAAAVQSTAARSRVLPPDVGTGRTPGLQCVDYEGCCCLAPVVWAQTLSLPRSTAAPPHRPCRRTKRSLRCG